MCLQEIKALSYIYVKSEQNMQMKMEEDNGQGSDGEFISENPHSGIGTIFIKRIGASPNR